MTAEDAKKEEQLKKEIWAKFGERLESMGYSELRLEKRDDLPPEQESAEKNCWLVYLGKVKKYAVVLVRCAYHGLAALVLLTQAPEAWHKVTNFLVPNNQQVVEYINNRYRGANVLAAPGEDKDLSYSGNYVLYDQNWLQDSSLLERDWTTIRQGDNILRIKDNSTLVLIPSSGSPAYVVQNSSST